MMIVRQTTNSSWEAYRTWLLPQYSVVSGCMVRAVGLTVAIVVAAARKSNQKVYITVRAKVLSAMIENKYCRQ